MAVYKTREEAEEDARKMVGWELVRVVVEDKVDIDGDPIIYILATEPGTVRTILFDGHHWGAVASDGWVADHD